VNATREETGGEDSQGEPKAKRAAGPGKRTPGEPRPGGKTFQKPRERRLERGVEEGALHDSKEALPHDPGCPEGQANVRRGASARSSALLKPQVRLKALKGTSAGKNPA
jgi:hypothetical protein